MKVLIVDDSQLIRMMVSGMLSEIGIEAAFAENGKVALDKLQAGETFDSILLDWNMPELNGPGFLDACNEHNLNPCPIIMMTTENSLEYIQTALKKGATEYIMKPFTVDILKEKLEVVLEGVA